ncbi:phosphate acetyltransferase, partial [Sinorhizobium medicae]
MNFKGRLAACLHRCEASRGRSTPGGAPAGRCAADRGGDLVSEVTELAAEPSK